LAAGFFAAGFLAIVVLAAGFFAAGFLAAVVLAAGFLAAVVFAAGFFAVVVFFVGLLAAGFFVGVFVVTEVEESFDWGGLVEAGASEPRPTRRLNTPPIPPGRLGELVSRDDATAHLLHISGQ